MLKFETMVRKLAAMKASSELGGGYGQIGSELRLVAMIYGKSESTVEKAVLSVYPKVLAKMAG